MVLVLEGSAAFSHTTCITSSHHYPSQQLAYRAATKLLHPCLLLTSLWVVPQLWSTFFISASTVLRQTQHALLPYYFTLLQWTTLSRWTFKPQALALLSLSLFFSFGFFFVLLSLLLRILFLLLCALFLEFSIIVLFSHYLPLFTGLSECNWLLATLWLTGQHRKSAPANKHTCVCRKWNSVD